MSLCLLPPVSSSPPPDGIGALSPVEVVERIFRFAELGKIEDAMRLTATFPAVPREVLVQDYIEFVESRRTTPRTVAHLQLQDVAVVILNDLAPTKTRIDLDPAYLIRIDGAWLVLPKWTKCDRKQFEFDEPTLQRFAKLKAWFKSQKPELVELLRTL